MEYNKNKVEEKKFILYIDGCEGDIPSECEGKF